MAELVDALDSGSSQGNLVDVRVILAALTNRYGWILKHKDTALVEAHGAWEDFSGHF